MFAVPADTPVTVEPTLVATAVLLLVQLTPPPVASVRKMLEPAHTVDGPVIGAGFA